MLLAQFSCSSHCEHASAVLPFALVENPAKVACRFVCLAWPLPFPDADCTTLINSPFHIGLCPRVLLQATTLFFIVKSTHWFTVWVNSQTMWLAVGEHDLRSKMATQDGQQSKNDIDHVTRGYHLSLTCKCTLHTLLTSSNNNLTMVLLCFNVTKIKI